MSSYTDAAVDRLRTLVSAIEQEMVKVSSSLPLRVAWEDLVSVLALGPVPQTRECPDCHGMGMRAASRCGHCWAALAPLPVLVEQTPRQDS